jgi:hypothetical protein
MNKKDRRMRKIREKVTCEFYGIEYKIARFCGGQFNERDCLDIQIRWLASSVDQPRRVIAVQLDAGGEVVVIAPWYFAIAHGERLHAETPGVLNKPLRERLAARTLPASDGIHAVASLVPSLYSAPK